MQPSTSALEDAACEHRLAQYLTERVPREQWAHLCVLGYPLLHLAASYDDVLAVVTLLRAGVPVDQRAAPFDRTAAHVAAMYGCAKSLQVLLAAGTHVHAVTTSGHALLSIALYTREQESVRVLLLGGMRLAHVDPNYRAHVEPWMWAVETGRLHCRAMVVGLLGIKRRRVRVLTNLDKFIVREVALAIWATRAQAHWSR